jgi:hypothetical protein
VAVSKRYRSNLLRGDTYVPGTNKSLIDEHDGVIALHKLRIQQQRIHASELSADPTQHKHAQAQVGAMTASLVKLHKIPKTPSEAAAGCRRVVEVTSKAARTHKPDPIVCFHRPRSWFSTLVAPLLTPRDHTRASPAWHGVRR